MKPTILWLISNNNNNNNKCVDVINFLQQSVLTAWTKSYFSYIIENTTAQ